MQVIRLFGRMQSLKNIVAALTTAIAPVFNAFTILLIVAAICAFRKKVAYLCVQFRSIICKDSE